VKKLLLHIILAIVILDTTCACQILKLPLLIRHYTEHKILNPDIDVIEFLSMHYWGEDMDDNDEEKDMELPFKKFEIEHLNIVPLPNTASFSFKITAWPISLHYCPEKQQIHEQTAVGFLFRPPRV